MDFESVDKQRLLLISSYLIDYPFAERLYPRALEAIRHLRRFGKTVILTDGDVVFQSRKVHAPTDDRIGQEHPGAFDAHD